MPVNIRLNVHILKGKSYKLWNAGIAPAMSVLIIIMYHIILTKGLI